MGPVEYIVVGFPGNQFNGEIVPALQQLVEDGMIRILDLVFVHKDEDGNITVAELEDEPWADAFDGLDGELGLLLTEDDSLNIGAQLPPNSSGALLVWENVWSERFANAARNSGGELLMSGRISPDALNAARAYVAGDEF